MPEDQTSQQRPMIDIKDLSGLGAPLTKLIETVQAGGGRISDAVARIANVSLLAGKDSKNKAQDILLTGRANNQVLLEQAKGLFELSSTGNQQLKSLEVADGKITAQIVGLPSQLVTVQEQTMRRMVYQNIMHQLNLDAITAEAAAILTEEEQIASEPVNQDWANRFFRYGEDISTDEMQTLWGRILAGEIKKPGTFSIRTLEVMRNLSPDEAAAFTSICNYIIEVRTASIKKMFCYKGAQPFTSKSLWQRVQYEKILLLMECGLLQADENAKYNIEFEKDKDVHAPIKIGSEVILVSGMNKRSGPLIFPIYNLTIAGKQLASLVTPKTPIDFVVDFAKPFQAFDLKVTYAEFSHWGIDDSLHIKDGLLDLPELNMN